jgi:hypothetical protein
VLGVSTGDIFVCWGYLLVIYLCVGVSTGDLFVCWVYLLVIYLCVGVSPVDTPNTQIDHQ